MSVDVHFDEARKGCKAVKAKVPCSPCISYARVYSQCNFIEMLQFSCSRMKMHILNANRCGKKKEATLQTVPFSFYIYFLQHSDSRLDSSEACTQSYILSKTLPVQVRLYFT